MEKEPNTNSTNPIENNTNTQNNPLTQSTIEPKPITVSEPIVNTAPQAVPPIQPIAPVQQAIPVGQQAVVTSQPETKNDPGLLVLQWITYAAWGWLALALSAIIPFNIISILDGYEPNTVYVFIFSAAITIVLALVAAICDIFYLKKEPVKKSGGSAIIMILHAVLIGLFTIGWLISTLFVILSLSINIPGLDTKLSTVLSFSIVTFVYIILLVRILALKAGKLSKPIVYALIAISVLFIILSTVGAFNSKTAIKEIEYDVYPYGVSPLNDPYSKDMEYDYNSY